MTAADPVTPVMVVGPVPVSVQSVGAAVPPAAAPSTCLTSVSRGGTAVFVIVQVASWPSVNVTAAAVDDAAPVHTHAEAV